MKTTIISISHEGYPYYLKQIRDCPEKLFCRGNVDLLREHKILAVVGSRKISGYGVKVISKLIPALVKQNWVIVSGMALGVDGEVHVRCIKARGKTIAVLASGADLASPGSNTWIYEKILENGGLIVSEYKDGTPPRPEYFLKRNRIMAGLSQGVLVIEASARSGSMATAALAAVQGREVWAVPGNLDQESAEGTNYLIKNGAGLVTEAEDVVSR